MGDRIFKPVEISGLIIKGFTAMAESMDNACQAIRKLSPHINYFIKYKIAKDFAYGKKRKQLYAEYPFLTKAQIRKAIKNTPKISLESGIPTWIPGQSR